MCHPPTAARTLRCGEPCSTRAVAPTRVAVDDRRLPRHVRARPVGGLTGNDVHRGKERVGSVDRRQRTLDDLNPLHGGHGNVLGPDEGVQIGPEIHGHAVDHHLDDARPGIETAADASHRHRGRHEVVDNEEARHVREHLGERLPTVGVNLVARHLDDVRGRERALLAAATARGDHLLAEE